MAQKSMVIDQALHSIRFENTDEDTEDLYLTFRACLTSDGCKMFARHTSRALSPEESGFMIGCMLNELGKILQTVKHELPDHRYAAFMRELQMACPTMSKS